MTRAAGLDEAIWLAHRRAAFEALCQMLAQYRGDAWDEREATVGTLLEEPALVFTLVSPGETAQRTAATLSGHALDWFCTLQALAACSERWLTPCAEPGDHLSHSFMTAGEWAIEELERYGLVIASATGAVWTEGGRRMLKGEFPS